MIVISSRRSKIYRYIKYVYSTRSVAAQQLRQQQQQQHIKVMHFCVVYDASSCRPQLKRSL